MKIYDSLTKLKREFTPLSKGRVLIYVCGITPYDTTHLGHASTSIYFDVARRYLEFKNYQVKYIQNVTDIDDDILKKAKEEGKDWKKLGDYWTKQYLQDLRSLNVLLPTKIVYATESIPKMIEMISVLIERGFAYFRGGNVYFEVKKFPGYGSLSRFSRNQMMVISSERGADIKDPQKKDPLDFILWQKSKKDEPSWESPFGNGRPGWHIECSAMVLKYLGEQIDIHGGGRDLIYPHHESEIAQSQSYTKKAPFVKNWLHTGMVMFKGEKMSKSLGNLVLIKDLLKKYSPSAIRWLILSNHYRRPWEFDEIELEQAVENLGLIDKILGGLGNTRISGYNGYFKKFMFSMEDDLNTPGVLAVILDLTKKIMNKKDERKVVEYKSTLKFLVKLLGLTLR